MGNLFESVSFIHDCDRYLWNKDLKNDHVYNIILADNFVYTESIINYLGIKNISNILTLKNNFDLENIISLYAYPKQIFIFVLYFNRSAGFTAVDKLDDYESPFLWCADKIKLFDKQNTHLLIFSDYNNYVPNIDEFKKDFNYIWLLHK